MRRLFAAVSRRDAEEVFDLYDPQIELDFTRAPLRHLLGEGVYRGHEGLRRFFREWGEAYEFVEDAVEELIEVADRVVTVQTSRGRGRVSGIEGEREYASVWSFQNGRIVRMAVFSSTEEALEVAGRPSGG